MKKKMMLSLVLGMLALGVATGCDSTEVENPGEDNGTQTIETVTPSESYTELEIHGAAKVKFKYADPTYLWNSEFDLNAGEVDTILVPSENGEPIEDYFDEVDISYVLFNLSDLVLDSDSDVKKTIKKMYGVDNLQIEKLDDEIYSKHLKGETSEVYYEAYCFQYKGTYGDGELSNVYYSIELLIYKDQYTQEVIEKLISEYHIIIDTFEFVK